MGHAIETTKATIESRKQIGFPDRKEDWAQATAIYDGNETLRIAGHPVMEAWETGYMQTLARIASSKGGAVLELGFGLGLSARAIQDEGIKEHFLIECHPDVIAKAMEDFRTEIAENRFHLLTGFWQDITPKLANGTFKGILFDTYPLTEEEIHGNHFWFFKEAYRLLAPGGVFTYYSDEARGFSDLHIAKLIEAGFKKDNINFEICDVNPPPDCEYWQEKTIIAPIIIKAA